MDYEPGHLCVCVTGMVILNTKLAGKTPRADSNLSWVSGTLENPTIVDREVDQCIQEESSEDEREQKLVDAFD
eukprot:scaffold115776_cov53-Attheya_sp.AAC.3